VGVIIFGGLCHFRPIRVSSGTCSINVGIFAWFVCFHELHTALPVESEVLGISTYILLLISVHTVK
jgi:hypothetical protein